MTSVRDTYGSSVAAAIVTRVANLQLYAMQYQVGTITAASYLANRQLAAMTEQVAIQAARDILRETDVAPV
jgi:hypothetical protein